VQLHGWESQGAMHDVVCLGDELHVGILDAVVHHLDIVARASGADVGDTGVTVRPGCNGGEDGLDHPVGLGLPPRHDGWSRQSSLFATRYPGADVVDAVLGEFAGTALGVAEERVAPVDDEVSWLQERLDLGDDLVHGVAGLDHDHDLAGLFQ